MQKFPFVEGFDSIPAKIWWGQLLPSCNPDSDGPGAGQKKGDELCVQFRHIFKDMLSLDARCQQGWGALIRHPGGAIQYILHRLPGRESLQYD